MSNKLFDKIYGCLLGGLIGDAIGGPSEDMTWQKIEQQFGWIDSFEGCGTDDTVIKLILTDAIMKNKGNVTADEWAESFLEKGEKFYPLYYAPVRNMYHKLQYEETLPVYTGIGNSPSSSSAMAIAPMGIINACNPRRAAAETYDLAGMIHQGEATFLPGRCLCGCSFDCGSNETRGDCNFRCGCSDRIPAQKEFPGTDCFRSEINGCSS